MKKTVKVVAAIIENENNEILCALRSPKMAIPNMWEFPGGKVEPEEDIFSAIVREIDEELNCSITPIELFKDTIHEYDAFIINLIAIRCKIENGTPISKEHSKIVWLRRENLDSLKWAPTDIPIVGNLTQQK